MAERISIGSVAGATKEAEKLFKSDAMRRAVAKGILDDKAIASEYGLAEELKTTLNGEYRAITNEDLAMFRQRVNVVRSRSELHKLKGGIRPMQVIAFAKPSPNIVGKKQFAPKTDIGRANDQIKMAVMVGGNKGLLKFVTNASGETKGVTRHHVNVRLMSYGEAAAMPKPENGERALGKWLANEPVKFECDCGRHTYWYRYVASIGGWAEGRIESGYPKIRNPNLIGIACKHVLRVMRELSTSHHLHQRIGKMAYSDSGRVFASQKAADKRAKQQAKAPKQISQSAAKAAVKALRAEVAKELLSMRNQRRATVGVDRAKQEALGKLQALVGLGVLSQQQYEAMAKEIGK